MFSTTYVRLQLKIKNKVMKKMLFGLIATVMFGLNANAQKMTKEEARVTTAKLMIEFTNQLRPAFESSKDFKSFEMIVCGPWLSRMPSEGNEILKEAYNFLSLKVSDDEILNSYSGIGIVKALKFQNDILVKNPESTGTEIFGGSGDGSKGDYNAYSSTLKTAPCKWYQISCWIDQIFGNGVGSQVIQILITLFLPLP